MRGLGAAVVGDYRSRRFEDGAGEVDVVLDTVGGETLERSKRVLKAGGTLLSVATDGKATPYFFYVEGNRAGELTELARLIDGGLLRPIVGAVLPLEQAREAYRHGVRRGKVVLRVG